jgi:hypothetical protein
MALGKWEVSQRQFWVSSLDEAGSPWQLFSQRLNEVFRQYGFDRFAERLCRG